VSARDRVPPDTTSEGSLRRVLGRWDLTAIGINQVIGGAIFLVPAQVYFHLGAWSPIAMLAVGVCSMLVALCFAEAGSRFESTGGAYLYSREAFGPFIGMEVAWMQWFTRVTSLASVASGICIAVGFYFPAVGFGVGRNLLLTAIMSALMVVNIWGIKQSANFVNFLAVSKLVPLFTLIFVGVWFIKPQAYLAFAPAAPRDMTAAALLLVFAFGGFDIVGIPAGESRSPRQDIPFALITTVVGVTLIFTSVQIVLMGTSTDLAHTQTPVADVMHRLLGPVGALLVAVGAVLSMIGNNMGQILSGSRVLFALAERRELTPAFARVHTVRRTPVVAIVVTTLISLTLAFTGTFVILASVSAVARLTAYAGTAAATLKLRRMDREQRVPKATFVIPGGPTVPILALASSMLILVGATWEQLAYGVAALLAGVILFLIAKQAQPISKEESARESAR
jgi:APA family basic amino acid/polyamine antiporter